jgi:hypothetical protein
MDDGYTQTLSGLIRKRAVIAGELEALRDQLDLKTVALGNLDAAIRIFKPDIDFEDMAVRRVPPPHVAFRGELARFLIDQLRKATKPLSTRELADAVMKARGISNADLVMRRTMCQRVGHSLYRMKLKGITVSERGPGGGMMWWGLADGAGYRDGKWRNGSAS